MWTMRRAPLPVALGLLWILSPIGAHAAAACTTTTASLSGWYAMLVTGATTAATPAAKYQVGAIKFDGAGGLTAQHVLSGAGRSNGATGTYVLNGDCTLSVFITIGATAVQTYTVAMKSATEAVGIETDAKAVATIDLQAQHPKGTAGTSFTQASLNGTVAASCIGPISASSDLNLATLSNGTISGTDPFNNGGSFQAANNPYSGTYTVSADGTFTGSLVVGGTTFDFVGVASTGGAEIEYLYENDNAGKPSAAFASCVGMQ